MSTDEDLIHSTACVPNLSGMALRKNIPQYGGCDCAHICCCAKQSHLYEYESLLITGFSVDQRYDEGIKSRKGERVRRDSGTDGKCQRQASDCLHIGPAQEKEASNMALVAFCSVRSDITL